MSANDFVWSPSRGEAINVEAFVGSEPVFEPDGDILDYEFRLMERDVREREFREAHAAELEAVAATERRAAMIEARYTGSL